MKHLTRIFFFVTVVAIVASLTPVQAVEYGGIGGRPAFPNNNPKSQSIFLYTGAAGTNFQDAVKVVNNTNENKTISVYAADSTPSTDGGYACEQQVETKNQVGGWISLEQSEVTLAPKTETTVPFKLTVPNNADVGEHNGCILIQEKKEQAANQTGIQLAVRTGMRVAITVPGDIVRKLELVSFDARMKEDKKAYVIRPSIRNVGNVSVDGDLSVKVKNMFGQEIESFGGQYNFLRDDTTILNFELPRPFWGGWHSAQLHAEYKNGLQAENLNSTVTFWVAPSAMAIAIIVVVLLAVILLIVILAQLILRMMRRRKSEETWVSYKVKKDDTVESVAKSHKTTWQEIARVNKLKAPYQLAASQIILVPDAQQNTSKTKARRSK